MRALVNRRIGGPEVLAVEEHPTPVPSAGEVLVKVQRAGLNFADVFARVGLYHGAPRFPAVMGYEAAGVVESVGGAVSGVAVGQRVMVMARFGAHATHVVAPAGQVSLLPDEVSLDDAAALPLNYLTAYHALFHVAPLRPGMSVLIHAAGGGVGLAAIQLAKTVPGVTLYGTASPQKHAFLRSVGLDEPIDYRSTDYAAEVRRLTAGEGVDRVLDCQGGRDWARGYALLRPAGHLVCYGWQNMLGGGRRSLIHSLRQLLGMPRFSPMRLMADNRAVSGMNVTSLWVGANSPLREHLRQVLELARLGRVKPQIDSVVPLSRAAEGHERLERRLNLGKVLFDCEA